MSVKTYGWLWGILLVPFTLATLLRLPLVMRPLESNTSAFLWIAGGAAGYALFEALFSRPMRTYVFGHELTHALAALMMGAKVHGFKVAKDGGHVELSKSNFLVALAPYCVPLYTLLALVLFWAAGFWWPVERWRMEFLALVGATLAFHVSLTAHAVRQKQPDIHQTGVLFSAVFIALVNAWTLVLLTKILFWSEFPLRQFVMETFWTHLDLWQWVGREAARVVRRGYLFFFISPT